MNKSTLLLLVIITLTINSYSQDYFVVENDTTFCKELRYTTSSQGYLKKIEFINSSGDEITLKGRKDVPDVNTFYFSGNTFDKIPLKASKPKSYIRYTKRVVDGKLKIYLATQKTILIRKPDTERKISENTVLVTKHSPEKAPVGHYRFFIKMPDGTYYKINNKKNLKKYIEPYLLKCVEFEKQFEGFDFDGTTTENEEQFKAEIELYNSLCK